MKFFILYFSIFYELSESNHLSFIKFYSTLIKDIEPDYNYTTEWLTQRVDHFSYANSDTYMQRYLINTDYWCDSCPIFLYLGCEADITYFVKQNGLMWDHAQMFRAMLLFVEHRYYGQSIPYGKLEKTTIGYLTTEQALADYAVFTQHIKQKYEQAKNSPIILFGGSYCGMLVAWFRIKYPHLSTGGLSSSAPLLKFPGMYDCNGWANTITKDYRSYSDKCSQSIRNSWAPIRKMFRTIKGRKSLGKIFTTCAPLQESDQDDFILGLSNMYANQAMMDYPDDLTFFGKSSAFPVKEACKFLTDPDDKEMSLLTNINKAALYVMNYTGSLPCMNYQLTNPYYSSFEFQACTELVFPDCSNGKTDMFDRINWNFTKVSEQCFKKYGVYPEPSKIPRVFGGKNITFATNIIFTNGLKDPWMPGGILETLSPTLIAIKIPSGHHGEDLRLAGPNDAKDMKSARKKILTLFKQWLNFYYKKNHIKSEFEN